MVTHLDEAQPYVNQMNYATQGAVWRGPVPGIGHRIEFIVHRHFSFRLEVVGVTYNQNGSEVRVELHMGREHPSWSIRDWTTWFQRGKARTSG